MLLWLTWGNSGWDGRWSDQAGSLCCQSCYFDGVGGERWQACDFVLEGCVSQSPSQARFIPAVDLPGDLIAWRKNRRKQWNQADILSEASSKGSPSGARLKDISQNWARSSWGFHYFSWRGKCFHLRKICLVMRSQLSETSLLPDSLICYLEELQKQKWRSHLSQQYL